ncbi:MAG TPA: amidase [Actinomycetes bacterium]|nr:amidase [Actinomycetes bacterium]
MPEPATPASSPSDLHYLSATDALALFRTRELSPVELLEAVIARAEQTEPDVNAFSFTYYDRALEQAKAAERVYANDPDSARPLEGLPIGLKDEVEIAGEPATAASLAYRDDVAEQTTPLGERILESGGIIHARTTTPEFCCAGFTHSKLYGVTRNPWNLHYGVGGSSGGSGASLAAGSSTLASGSDIGGSIRIPASFNGVVGFKPPYGRVPVEVPFNMDTYCHNGPLARTVADCALFENALAGPHPDDHTSLRPKLEIPAELDGIEGLRIGVTIDYGGWAVDPEVRRNTLDAAMALRDVGAVVEEVDLVVDREMVDRAIGVHYQTMFAAWIGGEAEKYGDLLNDYSIEFARITKERGGGVSVLEGMQVETELWRPIGALFEQYDVLIAPTSASRGFVAGDGYVGKGFEVDGQTLPSYIDALMTPLFNLASRCPVLNVPSGFADNGVPTGIQIVARTFDDVTAFRVGAALEQVRPFWAGQQPSFTSEPFGSD